MLFLRKAIIIGTVVFGPFAMAGLASGKTKSWAVKWVEVVIALALSKFVICVILTLAYSAVGASVTGDITDAFLGSIWVLLAAFSPLAVLRFAHFAGDQIGCRQHLRCGRCLGQREAGRSPGHSRGRSRRAASSAGPPGGSPAEPAVTPKRSPADPGGGGRRPRRAPTTQQASPAGQSRHGNGSGGPASPGGSAAVKRLRQRPERRPGSDRAAGFGTAPPTQRIGSPRRRKHRIARYSPRWTPTSSEAAQNRSAVVTPAAAAAHLGVPQTQADRMFLHVRSQAACSVPNSPAVPAGSSQHPSTTGATDMTTHDREVHAPHRAGYHAGPAGV